MKPNRLLTWSLTSLVAAGLVFAPGEAFAKKKKKKRRAAATATVPNGNGIGPGGVPALRDALNARIDAVQSEVDALEERTEALEEVQSEVDDLELLVMMLDERLAAIEPRTTDDDGDGFAEFEGDCDDENDAVNPLADEIPGNGIDDDCDFDVDEDDGAEEGAEAAAAS